MINKSKLGAIAFTAATGLATIGLTSSAFAATPYPNYGPQNYAPSQSGGGSIGYNEKIETYRAHHHRHPHAGARTK